ncbi:MAG: hypothetical protein AB7M12_14110 [Hyphomonadaceae bacterium]
MKLQPLLAIVALFALAVGAAWLLRDRLGSFGGGSQFVYLLMAALLVGGGLFYRGRLGPDWLRNAALWVAIFAGGALLVGWLAPGFR